MSLYNIIRHESHIQQEFFEIDVNKSRSKRFSMKSGDDKYQKFFNLYKMCIILHDSIFILLLYKIAHNDTILTTNVIIT